MNKQWYAALSTAILLLALLVLGASSLHATVHAQSTPDPTAASGIPQSYSSLRAYTPPPWGQRNLLSTDYTAPMTGTLPALAITKHGPARAQPGEPITYTLTVSNFSATVLAGLVVTDILPIGSTYLGGGARVGDVVEWSGASLDPLSAITLTFTVAANQTITNTTYGVTAAGGHFAAGTQPVVTQVGDFCAFVMGIPRSECEALVALYNGTNGPNWTNNAGWLVNTAPCSWYGITCASGRVTQVSLFNNQLSGAIPPEIGNLTGLQHLQLSLNRLTGPIPPEIGSLTALQALGLYGNQLRDPIPPQIGNLTAVQYLDLANNELSGAIPPEIGSLAALHYLYLFNNRLSGAIPPAIGSLTALQQLYLYNNQLSGDVPPAITSLGNLVNDSGADLGYNKLTASDPAVIAFLNAKDSDWANTQTVPPSNPAATPSGGSVLITWTPIPYTWDGGYYEISFSDSPAGPYTVHGTTGSKYASGYTVTGLPAGATYYFRLRTYTPSSWSQQNALWSDYTAPVSAALPALSITKSGPAWAQPGEPITYTLTVRNNSTTPIASLDVTDTVPSGATYLGGGTLIVDVVVWSVPSLEPASAISFQFSVTATQTITNSIYRVTAASGDFAAGSQPVVTHIGDICSSVTGIPQSECEALVALYNATGGPNWTNNTGWLVSTTPCDMFWPWLGVGCMNGHVYQLSLSSNHLNGVIPPQIGNLTALQTLSLASNQLSGSIPPEIGNLTALQFLDVWDNQLSGSLPSEAGDLTALQSLSLANNQLEGSIPPEIGSLAALQTLVLYGNALSGVIPPEIGDMTALRYLDLSRNHLSGAIPPEIGKLTALQDLWLSGNPLSGAIPPEIGDLTALQYLILSGTPLSGTIPVEIGNLTALISLQLQDNQLSGALPPEIGDLGALQSLNLANNRLSGDIPPEIGSLTALRSAALSNNQLSGAIPAQIGNLTALQSLDLSNNQLSGAIPPEIGDLSALQQLVLERNQLSGAIPPEIGGLTALQWLNVSNNHLSGAIPPAIGDLSALQYLWLEYNQLSGSIPPEIGSLTALQHLLLEHNQLGGEFPTSITNLVNLMSLTFDCTLTSTDPDVIAFLMAKAPAAWQECTTTGMISGVVLLGDGSTVITDALISMRARGVSSGTISRSANVSQVDGRYTISRLPPGTYKVQANNNRAPGYVSKYYDDKYTSNTADIIEIAAGQTVSGINFALEPGGSISGAIYEADGVTAVANARVTVNVLDQNDSVAQATTDAQGRYTVHSLEPRADYKVQASADGYLRAFYPDQARWTGAGAVSVSAGQTTSGKDIRLIKADAYITGRVTYGDGTPVANVWMEAFHTDGWFVGISANANGEYRSPVIGGAWQVFPYKPPYRANSRNVTLTSGQTVNGVDFVLEAGGAISGHVYRADGVTPIANAWVYAMDSHFDFVGGGHSQADGGYLIDGLSQGSYYLAVQAGGYGGVYYPNGHDDPHAVAVSVTPPVATPDIDFTLSPEATASGIVWESDAGTPVSNARIQVWPRHGGQIREAFSDGSGAFTVPGLSTGSYVAQAEAAGFVTEFYLNAPSWGSATPFDVLQPQNTGGITFTLASTTQSAEVNPIEGGSLVYTDTTGSQTSIQVPPGAVTTTVTLEYTAVPDPSDPPNLMFAGKAFELEALQDGQPLETVAFQSPVTITIEYTDRDVSSLDENSLTLYYWDESTQAWLDGASSCTPPSLYTRQPDENWLAVPICHLSRFSLFGEPERRTYLPLVIR